MVQPAAMAGGHLADDLIQRPVPGRDQGADADRFLDHARRSAPLLEFIVFQRRDGGFDMPASGPSLSLAGKGERRPHFLRYGPRDILETFDIDVEYAAQQGKALGLGGKRERGKCCLCRRDRTIDVGMRSHRDGGKGFFVGGIDHIELGWRHRLDPGAINIELQMI
jgi:hypothetical protein